MEAPKPSQDTASLIKRLAGPSTGKAGLAKDQTDINRIIAEASKGSKFYENEKKKDKDLTRRIASILKQRDDAMKGADINKIETGVDRLILELESQRDLSQIIVHVDMDAFFANCELLLNPDLKGKAFGVGGGVLSTASYEARKFGVRSGMAGFIAKKLCPDLILVKSSYGKYSEMSDLVMDVFARYDLNMCPAGCDEAYLNITAYCEEHGLGADECVSQMRQAVFEETGLTVSAGIAPNKMLAKICSDKNKPNGQFHLPFDAQSILAFMHDLSIRKIPGIGRVSERLLDSIGIKTCGDIHTHRATLSVMDKHFGLGFLLRTHLGIASNLVQPHERQERKSIGAERTFSPLDNKDQILQKLEEVAVELEKDMNESGWTGRTVTLKYKLDTYQVFTRAKSFDRWITKKEELFATGKDLLLPEFPLKLRLIGLRLTKLKDTRHGPAGQAGGIKRFFEALTAPTPNKKRRIHDLTSPEHNVEFDPTAALVEVYDDAEEYDEDEDVLPEYRDHDHELEDVDMDGGDDRDEKSVDEDERKPITSTNLTPRKPPKSPKSLNSPNPRPPVSARSKMSNPHRFDPTSVGYSRKPHSMATATNANAHASSSTASTTSTSVNTAAQHTTAQQQPTAPDIRPGSPHPPSQQQHPCPICNKILTTDNQGLNAHIDFCLSRGAIWEAQGEASAGAGGSVNGKTNGKAKESGKTNSKANGKAKVEKKFGASGGSDWFTRKPQSKGKKG